MKILAILLFFISSLCSYSQNNFDDELKFQNQIRKFYQIQPLEIELNLTVLAQKYAENLAATDEFELQSPEGYYENMYAHNKEYGYDGIDFLLDASILWLVDKCDEDTQAAFNTIVNEELNYIGFGVAENNEQVYVIALYK